MAKTPRDFIGVHLPEGTLKRIDEVLYGGEWRTGLAREAILTEIERRLREYDSDPRRQRRLTTGD